MKWHNEKSSKTEFMKINSFNFIQNEKFNSELVHEKNAGKFVGPAHIESKTDANLQQSSHHLRQPSRDDEKENRDVSRTTKEFSVITESSTDYVGAAPKRYVTQCFLKPTSVPCWYTESLFLNINSTKRTHTTKVYIKNKLVPVRWIEHMTTEVKTRPKFIRSEAQVSVDEPEYHYISLEPQQEAVKVTSL